MTAPVSSSVPDVFALPPALAAKSTPVLLDADRRHFVLVADALEAATTALTARLAEARSRRERHGEAAMERDADVRRITARLRTLQRFGVDLCLGRMVPVAGDPVYVGRLGLSDDDGRRLLVDWRTPAAAPFFGATPATPMGLHSRRRYRWKDGRVVDYWDEVFDGSGDDETAALDDRSAFVASLGTARTSRMRDVLGTLAADQDAVIRAGAHGALVVDGGPGTGKTVVALHRAAFLLHAEPRMTRQGGVLVLGPHEPYLDYVADVLPSLGEHEVALCTVRDLVPEGAAAEPEPDSEVARLKAGGVMVDAVEAAVRFHETPPREGMTVETPWTELWFGPSDWEVAFAAVETGSAHHEARTELFVAVVDRLLEIADDDESAPPLRRFLQRDPALRRAVSRAWPVLDAGELVGDLFSVPAFLRHCAPTLTVDERGLLQRSEPQAWTEADLPLLDAARRLLGDPEAERRRQQREVELRAEREQRARVAEELKIADDSELQLMSMLRHEDLQAALEDADRRDDPERLAGPFAHVVVDEAQELTDAQWRMVVARCPAGSLTVVGDRAQARGGFAETWEERLRRVGAGTVRLARLTVNYRTPAEIMAEAEPVIRTALPGANVPVSIRSTGEPVHHGAVAELPELVERWLAEHAEGVAAVIGASFPSGDRVRALSPVTAKGLEFDLVVLVHPERFGGGVTGAVDRYVAMTRSTGRLAVLT